MGIYKDAYIRYMEMEDIKYVEFPDGKVRVAFSGENMKSIPVYAIFDEKEGLVGMYCWGVCRFPPNKKELAYKLCNDLNSYYRWAKFFLDRDSDITIQLDAYVYPDTCGEECASLVRRIVNLADAAYPQFMRAIFS